MAARRTRSLETDKIPELNSAAVVAAEVEEVEAMVAVEVVVANFRVLPNPLTKAEEAAEEEEDCLEIHKASLLQLLHSYVQIADPVSVAMAAEAVERVAEEALIEEQIPFAAGQNKSSRDQRLALVYQVWAFCRQETWVGYPRC